MSDIVTRLAVAALCGLAVGVEREWSGHATGPHGRFAGMRTFLLLGGLGGCAGWLASHGEIALAVALVGGAMAFIVAAYVAAARPGGPAVEGTTERAVAFSKLSDMACRPKHAARLGRRPTLHGFRAHRRHRCGGGD